MAQFTKVNGDFLPVSHFDTPAYTNSGINAVTANVAVQPQGPKLEFFTATANGALTGSQILAGVQTIQQLSTIYIYQYGNATNNTFAFASYPVGAVNTTSLATSLVTNAGWAAGATVAAGATFLAGSDN